MVQIVEPLSQHTAAIAELKAKATDGEKAVIDDILRVLTEFLAEVTDLRIKLGDAAEALKPFAVAHALQKSSTAPGMAHEELAQFERAAKCYEILTATPRAEEMLHTMILAVTVADKCQQVQGFAMMLETHKVQDIGLVRRLHIAQGELFNAVTAWAAHKARIGADEQKKLVL